MILPTTYLGPASWFQDFLREPAIFEYNETFEKQTFRNRCLIRDAHGRVVRLTVPIAKVEHKQLTRDIRISYQQHWQHQHWMALVSSYKHKPYFQYYADYLYPFYEQEIHYLIDFNEGLTQVILSLLENKRPSAVRHGLFPTTQTWEGLVWTDNHPWQTEVSIIDSLFEHGPSTLLV